MQQSIADAVSRRNLPDVTDFLCALSEVPLVSRSARQAEPFKHAEEGRQEGQGQEEGDADV